MFPSPYGAWVVSSRYNRLFSPSHGFRPLTGCGLCRGRCSSGSAGLSVSVPLRGVGCVHDWDEPERLVAEFPSPYGAWVVSAQTVAELNAANGLFPSPYGAWVVSANLHKISAGNGDIFALFNIISHIVPQYTTEFPGLQGANPKKSVRTGENRGALRRVFRRFARRCMF